MGARLRLMASVITLGICGWVFAAPVTLEQAGTAAQRWAQNADIVNGALLGSDVSEVRAVVNAYGDTRFYVAKFAAGGFAVVAPDTRMNPVLAFSESDDIDESNDSPLYSLLCIDVESQTSAIEEAETSIQKAGGSPQSGSSVATAASIIATAENDWEELLAGGQGGGKAGSSPGGYSEIEKAGASRPSNVMVEPLVSSKWGQTTSGGSKRVYNAYVPYASDNSPTAWPCGCVATAFAQIMRYHRWPTSRLAAQTFATKKNSLSAPLTTIAGTFDWNNMPAVPAASPSTVQINAIAKLTYNVGVASEMNYKSGGSGTRMSTAASALTDYFDYKSAVTLVGSGMEKSNLESAVLANLEYGKPVSLGLRNSVTDNGHCVVADGYGYSNGKTLVHLNMGWSGKDDAWYLLPSVPNSVQDYDVFDTLVCNIFPQESGWIVCGKVTKYGGSAVSGATVVAYNSAGKTVGRDTTNSKGMYALLVPSSGTYTVNAISGNLEGDVEVTVVSYYNSCANKWGQDITVTAAPTTCTITFDANGGTGTMKAQTVKSGASVTLNKCTYSKAGARFLGWAESQARAQRGEIDYVDCDSGLMAMGDFTLYAVWEDIYVPPETYTVTFHPNGASGFPYSQAFDGADSLLACRFSRAGWKFLGWAEAADGGVEFYEGDYVDVRGDLDLYAVWELDYSSTVGWTITGDGYLSAVALNGETSVTIPSNVKTIGRGAFAGNATLEHVTIPASVTKIEMDAFSGCTALKEISIPANVAHVGDWAFCGCTELETASIAGGVERLGACLFYGCSGLVSVTLGEGTSVIPEFMFTGCSSLESIVVPASVAFIGYEAFDGCVSLSRVVFNGDAPDADEDVFADAKPGCVLSVRGDRSGWPSENGALWPMGSLAGRPVEILRGYVVSFDWNGWDGAPVPEPIAVEPGGTCDLPMTGAWRKGYDLLGWSDGIMTYSEKYKPSANTVLKASWQGEINLFRFDPNGGGTGGMMVVVRRYGDAWGDIETPSRDGFAFRGWFTARNGGQEVDISGVCDFAVETTFYAHWDKAYSVTVKGGEAQGENDDEPASKTFVAAGAGVMLYAEDRSDYGQIFSHWSVSPSSADLGDLFDARDEEAVFSMPAANVTLTANYVMSPGYVNFFVEIEDDTYNVDDDYDSIVNYIEWSADGKAWLPVPSDEYEQLPVKAGRSVALQFRSTNPRWIVPARTTCVVEAGWTTTVDVKATRTSIVEVEADEYEAPGTVSINPKNGQFLPGKPVTIAAKPGKDAVFAYWITDDYDRDFHATAKVSPNRDTRYTAVFRMKRDIADPRLDDESILESDTSMVGALFSMTPYLDDDAYPAKFSAKGLPPGLKIDAASGVISGMPTKAGTYTVTIIATGGANGKSSSSFTKEVTIEPLPAWAQGNFTGWVDTGDDYGLMTMSVSPIGKVSGKIALAGTNWTFSAASYAAVCDGEFEVEAVAKAGKNDGTVSMTVVASGRKDFACAAGNGYVELGSDTMGEIYFARSPWKDKGVAAAPFAGTYAVSLAPDTLAVIDSDNPDSEYDPIGEFGAGYASMTINAKGIAKLSGKLADGTTLSASSDLLWRDDAGWFVLFHTMPGSYKGGAVTIPLSFGNGGDGFVAVEGGVGWTDDDGFFTGILPRWINRNPAASSDYGWGWDRGFDISAAQYDKSMTLHDLGFGLVQFMTRIPDLYFMQRATDFDENGRKTTETWIGGASAEETDIPLVAANPAGTSFMSSKATKPFREDGDWYYEGENDGALTLSWNRATGVFKGAYTFWFDYISASDYTTDRDTYVHKSQKVSFEGIIVPGQTDARGFFLWDAIGEYEDERTETSKTYKFKESHGVILRGGD